MRRAFSKRDLAAAIGLAAAFASGAALADDTAPVDPVAGQLLVTAQSLNQVCPQKIDETLTLSTVSAIGKTLTYHYTFTDSAIDAGAQASVLNQKSLAQACHHPGMRKMMSVLDVAFVYSYAKASGGAPIEKTIDEAACVAFDKALEK